MGYVHVRRDVLDVTYAIKFAPDDYVCTIGRPKIVYIDRCTQVFVEGGSWQIVVFCCL